MNIIEYVLFGGVGQVLKACFWGGSGIYNGVFFVSTSVLR